MSDTDRMAALANPAATTTVLQQILGERARQDTKWGQQNHPDGTGPSAQVLPFRAEGDEPARMLSELARQSCAGAFATGGGTWADILLEEVFEALAEDDAALLRAELVQVAAVAAAWAEAIDRRSS